MKQQDKNGAGTRSKRIWLIGASSGIGRALALALAKSDYTLALSARNAQALVELQETIVGDTYLCVPFDVSNYAAFASAKAQLLDAWGAIERVVFPRTLPAHCTNCA